jgi:hypothetical protein
MVALDCNKQEKKMTLDHNEDLNNNKKLRIETLNTLHMKACNRTKNENFQNKEFGN